MEGQQTTKEDRKLDNEGAKKSAAELEPAKWKNIVRHGSLGCREKEPADIGSLGFSDKLKRDTVSLCLYTSYKKTNSKKSKHGEGGRSELEERKGGEGAGWTVRWSRVRGSAGTLSNCVN